MWQTAARHYASSRTNTILEGNRFLEIASAVLETGSFFRFQVRGDSMSPFVRSGDYVTFAPIAKAFLRSGRIVLFVSPNRAQVGVHRVVKQRQGEYLMRGDNRTEADGWIPAEHVLGYAIRIERGDRTVSLGLGIERFIITRLSRQGFLMPCVRLAGLVRSRIRRLLGRAAAEKAAPL